MRSYGLPVTAPERGKTAPELAFPVNDESGSGIQTGARHIESLGSRREV